MNDERHMLYRRDQQRIDEWAKTAVSAIAEAAGGLDAWRRPDVFVLVLQIWARAKDDDYSPMRSPLQRFNERQGEFRDLL